MVCKHSAPASAQNPFTTRVCGAPAVNDTYSATAEENGSGIVGGPMDCEQAADIARNLNLVNGCCRHQFAINLTNRAGQTARSRCNDRAGNNFACDIYLDNDNVCTGGCGLSVTPSANPMGCQLTGAPTCTSKATASRVTPGEQCMVSCSARAVASASGAFDVRCSTCTEQSNCEGLAQAEEKKKERLAELEAKKQALQQQLDSLNPQDPNYLQIAAGIISQITAIVSEINDLFSFFENLKKLRHNGDKCKDD